MINSFNNLLSLYNAIPYQKGAHMFRSLYLLIGETCFFKVLNKLADFYSDSTLSTSDLFNLVKVYLRNLEEDNICILDEDMFTGFWGDFVLERGFSKTKVERFEFTKGPTNGEGKVEIHFL